MVTNLPNGSELVSPKQAARALGVGESSLKRWCDKGLIQAVRTAGGHRKMPIAEVLRYVRDNELPLISPELLGLPPASAHANSGLAQGRAHLTQALLDGDELVARQVVFDLFLAKHSLEVVFDEGIAAAFREIGNRWACHDAEVYQERRGCEITMRILAELRRVQRIPERKWLATGGTMEGDHYSLPSAMAELILYDAGFYAESLGTSIPFTSLVKAVRDTRPHVFWLSVSHIREDLDFVTEFATLSQTCADVGTALIVGGRALTEELRKRMTYTAYCDNMQHLKAFATTLYRSLAAKRGLQHRRRTSVRTCREVNS